MNFLESFGNSKPTSNRYFVFDNKDIKECHIHYNEDRLYHPDLKWTASIKYVKNNISSEVYFESKTMGDILNKIFEFCNSIKES